MSGAGQLCVHMFPWNVTNVYDIICSFEDDDDDYDDDDDDDDDD